MSKVSARLGVSASDFEALVPKQQTQGRSVGVDKQIALPSDSAAAARYRDALHAGVAQMRKRVNFFMRRIGARVLAQVPEHEILVRILESELRPDDAASLNAFMATLSTPEEEDSFRPGFCKRCRRTRKRWSNMVAAAFGRRRCGASSRVAKDRIKLPQLSTGDVVNLQKKFLTCRNSSTSFRSPPAKADN